MFTLAPLKTRNALCFIYAGAASFVQNCQRRTTLSVACKLFLVVRNNEGYFFGLVCEFFCGIQPVFVVCYKEWTIDSRQLWVFDNRKSVLEFQMRKEKAKQSFSWTGNVLIHVRESTFRHLLTAFIFTTTGPSVGFCVSDKTQHNRTVILLLPFGILWTSNRVFWRVDINTCLMYLSGRVYASLENSLALSHIL